MYSISFTLNIVILCILCKALSENCQTKLDQTFQKYQVDEYNGFSMATLCFEEYARFWWTQRQSDVRIDTKLEI